MSLILCESFPLDQPQPVTNWMLDFIDGILVKKEIDKTHAKAIEAAMCRIQYPRCFFFAVNTLSRPISLLSFHEIEERAVFLYQQTIRGHWRIMFVLHQIQNAL